MPPNEPSIQTTDSGKTGRGPLAYPLMWLVLGIPAATVVAGFVTLYIAANGSDVPVPSYYAKQGLSVAPDTSREDRAREIGFLGTLDTQVEDDVLRIQLALKSGIPAPDGLPHPAPVSDPGPTPDTPADRSATPASTAKTGTDPVAPTPRTETRASSTSTTEDTAPRRLRLLHPSNPQDDLSIQLHPTQDGRWQARQPITWTDGTRWTVVIESDDWRLPLPGLLSIENLRQQPVDSRLISTPERSDVRRPSQR
ncbi:MAG: FixH family protein [Lautropia sp.]|nr:FixH family protein [Lautropia sp.]